MTSAERRERVQELVRIGRTTAILAAAKYAEGAGQ